MKCTHLHTFVVTTYLRRVAGEAANHILKGLRQVAALLPHADQEIIKLLTPAEPTDVNAALKLRPFSTFRIRPR